MKDVTVEDLKTKFVVAKVAPYGEVIMVPGGDFDPDWEAMLEEEGFGCVFTEINGEKFTLVKLEKEEEGGEEAAAEPRPEVRRRRGILPGKKRNLWSDADEERLLKRIEELPGTIEENGAQLLPEFPGRTATGLLKKYEKLHRLEKHRAKSGKTLTKKLLDEQVQRVRDAKKQVLADASIPAEYVSAESAGAQLDVVKTLAHLGDLVQALINTVNRVDIEQDFTNSKLHCAVVMQALEAQERRGLLTISPRLRERYLDALTSFNKAFVDVFLEKASSLVEASK